MPTKEETKEFFELLKRRHPEIVSILRDVRVADIIERNESRAYFSDIEDEPESEAPSF
jgi:hypothetical protein